MSDTPATTDDVYDLDAVIAERATTEQPFRFRFGGDLYELPPMPDFRAITAMSAGRLEESMRLLLGAEQWARLEASPAVFDVRAMMDLLNRYSHNAGIDLGEFVGSTGS